MAWKRDLTADMANKVIQDQQAQGPTPELIAGLEREGITVNESIRVHTEEDDPLPSQSYEPPAPSLAVGSAADVASGAAPVASGDILERLTRAIELLAAKQGSVDNDSTARLAAALEGLNASTIEGAKIQARATRVGQRHENAVSTGISTLNPRGEKDFPKPELFCEMLAPGLIDRDSVTREEIELLNLLAQHPGEYPLRRNDGSRIKMQVLARKTADSERVERMHLHHDTAWNNENQRLMPPLADMLRALLNTKPATKKLAALVLTMDEEMALIQAGQMNDGTVPADGIVISMGA